MFNVKVAEFVEDILGFQEELTDDIRKSFVKKQELLR